MAGDTRLGEATELVERELRGRGADGVGRWRPAGAEYDSHVVRWLTGQRGQVGSARLRCSVSVCAHSVTMLAGRLRLGLHVGLPVGGGCSHLANEASLAWHQRFGFREVPDFWIASCRARFFAHELERRKDLSEAERARLRQLADSWWAEAHRLEELRFQEYASAYPKAE